MAKSLVIVESPAKAKTIEKILGKDFMVKASAGHIRDLPKKSLGVDVKRDFLPQYVVMEEKERVVKELRSAAQESKDIYLAPDPDREGEAIAWHLASVLGTVQVPLRRIEFNEITRDAVLRAVASPRDIDMNRVNAQQARRVLDRLVGYKISPLLWSKVKRGLSAGRVQSVAVRLICDREAEIQAFVPVEYWTIEAELLKHQTGFFAELVRWRGAKSVISTAEQSQEVLSALKGADYVVSKVQAREQRKQPQAPFTTSTLQQDASRRFGFAVKRTMAVAQQLYEGLDLGSEGHVGLITYMRTDSVRVADEAYKETVQFVGERFGKPYLPAERRVYASKKGAQDAHEAIRPTSVFRTPDSLKDQLNPEQFKLYRLIWERFCASQMANAVIEVTTVEISAGSGLFRVADSRVVFPGFQAAYQEIFEEDAAPERQNKLPELKEHDRLSLKKLHPKQHFTQPPPRYTEASLVKALEELGIGRPSTYAPTIATIQDREYVVRENKALHPTELGKRVNDQLVRHFPDIVDCGFTSKLEQDLDAVEEGNRQWEKLLAEFYEPFMATLRKAEAEMQAVALPTGESCPNCGKQMVIKSGRFGDFVACENYPTCKTTKPLMKKLGMKCLRPGCEGEVVARKTKTGKLFYGCDRWPACDWKSWGEPTSQLCPKCNTYLTKQKSKDKGRPYLQCANVECKHIMSASSSRKTEETAASAISEG